MAIQRLNKRGYSLGGWTETAIVVSCFVLLFIGLIAEMNAKYNKDIDGTMGLQNLATNGKQNISDYQNTLKQSIAEGQSSSTGLGISLSTTWNIISAGATLMWSFITGGFIEQLGGLAHLPQVLTVFLRMLFVLSIGFIILRLVLKIKP